MDREFKGKSIIDFPSDYVVIDTETTGLDYDFCYLIEVAAVRYIDGKKVDTFTSLIKPPMSEVYYLDDNDDLVMESYYIDSYISSLTGITNEMLESAPTEDIVIPQFMDFIGASVLVGHNVNFDINFLYDAGFECGIKFDNDFIDTLRISRKLLPNLAHHRLSDLAAEYSAPVSSAHRALADCLTTAFCFQRMKETVLSTSSIADFSKSFYQKYEDRYKDVKCTVDYVDPTNPIYGKVIVFTGTLDKMPRKDALQIVANLGGIPSNSLNQQSNILVIGSGEFVSSVKNGKTNKMKKAEKIQQKGGDLSIMSEGTFFEMISDWL